MLTTIHSLENPLQRKLRRYAIYGSVMVCAIALSVLAGWAFDIHILKYPAPRLVAMNPMTATAFIFSGIALGFIDKRFFKTGKIIAIAITSIGILKLLAIDTGLDIGIDRWLFQKSVEAAIVNGLPNSMAPNTAVCFLLLGIAVTLSASSNPKARSLATYIAFTINVVSIFSLIGYVYEVKEFYGFLNFIPMAVHTAFCFLLISLTVLLFNSNYGFMQTFTSNYSGGVMARLLLPAMIFIPAILGWLRLWSNRHLPISVELGVALLITLIIVFFFAMAWILSVALNKTDKARSEAEASLRNFSAELEKNIAERTKELADYQFALDESSIVAITDYRGIIRHANDNFCSISKYSREELIGQDHRIVSSGYHSKEYIRNLWTTIASGNIWRGELKNKAKDGTFYWVDTTIVPFIDERKKPYQYIAIRADVTNRKTAEEELYNLNNELEVRVEQRTAQLAAANKEIAKRNIHFDRAHDIFLSASFEGFFVDFNDKLVQQLGFSREELLSIPFISLVHPDDVDESEKEIARIAAKGNSENFENRFRCKDDSYVWMQWSVVVYDNLIYAVGRNITQQKQQRQELISQAEKLNRVNNELESFSYSVSHDLRAPLRAVHGYAQMLSEDYGRQMDEEASRIISNIMSNAKKMGTLIDDLLSFSRLGRRELVKMKMQMHDMVKNICAELNDNPDTRHKVRFIIHPLSPVFADSVTMKQVWINLISNALKYSREKEKIIIEIGALQLEDETAYYIKDNGVGFDMRYAEKLFGVFQRLHSDEEFEGTGVGLAIVQRVIAKHGGRVWAESKINEGATFFFSLPNNITS